MLRSGNLKSLNDLVIEEIIQNTDYNITELGVFKNGKKLGRLDKEGYREIYYKGKRLKEHRIIYRKFNGKLAEDLVIEHKDGNPEENKPDNLMLTTQKKNIEYKNRRLGRK